MIGRHFVNASASPPNVQLQPTVESVTRFAVCHEADVDKEVGSCMDYLR
jgi:hypothetical protein